MPQLCCWVFVCLSFSQPLSVPPGVPVLRSYMGKQEPEGRTACHFTEPGPQQALRLLYVVIVAWTKLESVCPDAGPPVTPVAERESSYPNPFDPRGGRRASCDGAQDHKGRRSCCVGATKQLEFFSWQTVRIDVFLSSWPSRGIGNKFYFSF